MPTGNPIPITCAPCSASMIAPPTSSPIRAPRRRFRPSWIGPAASARRSRLSVADRACAAASSIGATRATRRRSPSISSISAACSRSTRPRAPRGSRPAFSGRRSKAQLKPHGLTLRHFPQSFAYSTLGGWIATRSGGHFATLYTHIDDLVESLRVVTPKGVIETRRLPGSGAGPSPDRLFIGSEGILGVISQAWMRLQAKPVFRAGGAVEVQELLCRGRAPCAPSRKRGSTRRTAASSIRPKPTTRAPRMALSRSSCLPSNRATIRSTPG